MVMQDTNYSDNVVSPTYGAPTFRISPCGSGCTKPYNTGQSVFTGSESDLACDTDREWNYNGSPAAAPAGGWYGYGVSNSTNYRWIAAQCDGNGQASGNTNLNTTSFVIPLGVNLSTYTIAGNWSADNYVDSISVNGTPIDIGNFTSVSGAYGTTTGYTSVKAYCDAMSVGTPDYSFGQLWPFTIPAGSNFQAGTNTLTFAVWGDDSLGGLLVVWDEPCDTGLTSSSSSSQSSTSSLSSNDDLIACQVRPDIFSNTVSYFKGGASFAAGTYTISYVSGAVSYSGGGNWTVTTEDFPGHGDGYFAVFNHASSESSDDHEWPGSPSQAADTDVAATQAGLSLTLIHAGGPIGMFLRDDDYGDNEAGPTVGAPKFQLSPCTDSLRVSAKARCGKCNRTRGTG